MMAAKEEELISIFDFATRYRVDVSVVRGWIKKGTIDYQMVGPRMMVRASSVVKTVPAGPPAPAIQSPIKDELIGYLIAANDMNIESATNLAGSLTDEDAEVLMNDLKGALDGKA